MKELNLFGISDIGMVRDKNEDSFIILEYEDIKVACVADGMGGHVGGKEASTIVANSVKNLFNKNRGRLDNGELINDCFLLANRKIREKSKNEYESLKIGSTCTLITVTRENSGISSKREKTSDYSDNTLTITFNHIGDSKLYLIKGEDIIQKSKDHTMLQRMLESGALNLEDAEEFPHKNIIYKSLGIQDQLGIDAVKEFIFRRGEGLLLCSDGLSEYVKPKEMVKILKGTKTIKSAAHYMVNIAKYRGGNDNITVIIIENNGMKRDKTIKLESIPKIRRKLKTKIRSKISSKIQVIIVLSALLFVFISLLLFLL